MKLLYNIFAVITGIFIVIAFFTLIGTFFSFEGFIDPTSGMLFFGSIIIAGISGWIGNGIDNIINKKSS